MAELTARAECCTTDQQAACCEPQDKAACCGHERGCGCRAAGEDTNPDAVREPVRERYAAAACTIGEHAADAIIRARKPAPGRA